MLETIREYAGELLAASPEAEAVYRGHAEFVLLLAERAKAVMTGADFSFAGEPEHRIQEELPNVRAALDWALGRDEVFALHLAVTAAWAWGLSGAPAEGRAWLRRTLEAAGHPESVDGAWALSWSGSLAGQEGDFGAARQFGEQALALFERHGNEHGAATVLLNLAYAAHSTGEVERREILSMRHETEQTGSGTTSCGPRCSRPSRRSRHGLVTTTGHRPRSTRRLRSSAGWERPGAAGCIS
jgi:hypothetical protein